MAQVGFSAALIAQHRAFFSSAYDFGFFDQIIWNTSQGRFFETSFLRYNFLGQHVEPVLLLFAAAYRLLPAPELMLIAQALAGAWAALPLYLAVRRLLASSTAGLLFAAGYLLAPAFQRAMLFDFHPEVMGTAAIFACLAFLVFARPRLALAAAFSLFLLKEDAAITALGLALLFLLLGFRRHACYLTAVAVLYLILVPGLLMTAVRGGDGDLQERYAWAGADPVAVLTLPLRAPGALAAHLANGPRRRAVAEMLSQQALLPLAGPAVLIAIPSLTANLLSDHPDQNQLGLHYGITPFALFTVAAVLGTARLAGIPVLTTYRRHVGLMAAAAFFFAQFSGWLLVSPLGPSLDRTRFQQTEHTRVLRAAVREIPASASVSAQSGILPHLSQRRAVWEFPDLRGAQYVVIDRKTFRSFQSSATFDDTLSRLPSLGYTEVWSRDGVSVFCRCSGALPSPAPGGGR